MKRSFQNWFQKIGSLSLTIVAGKPCNHCFTNFKTRQNPDTRIATSNLQCFKALTHHTPSKSLPRFKPRFLPILPNQCHCCNPVESSLLTSLLWAQNHQNKVQLTAVFYIVFKKALNFSFLFLVLLSNQI